MEIYTWKKLEADAAFYKETLMLRRSLNPSQYVHYLLVSKGIYEKTPDDRFVVRSRSGGDKEEEAYFAQVKAKLPSGTRNPLYTAIKEGSLLWDQVEGHSVARFDTDRFRNALRGSGFIIPNGTPGYIPKPINYAARKFPERPSVEDPPTSPNQATMEKYVVNRKRSPRLTGGNFDLTLADDFLSESSASNENESPSSSFNKPNPTTPSPPRSMPPPEEQQTEQSLITATVATPGHHPTLTRCRSSTPYATEPTRTKNTPEPATLQAKNTPEETAATATQGGEVPSISTSPTPTPPEEQGPSAQKTPQSIQTPPEEQGPNTPKSPQGIQPNPIPPKDHPLTFEERIRMIRFNPEANPEIQLDTVIQKLATLTAKISNVNRSITRDCERYTTGVPSILLQAPPIKTPQTADYGESFYEDANKIILQASMALSHRCIMEQHRILKKNQEEFDAILASILPRTLTEEEWEQIYNLANKRRTTAQPSPPNTTDPATIRFLIPPDQGRNHNFIYPNPQVKRMYTTQGQRPAASTSRDENQRNRTDSDRRPNRSKTRRENRQGYRPDSNPRNHRDRSPAGRRNPSATRLRDRSGADHPDRSRAGNPSRPRSSRHRMDPSTSRRREHSITRRPHQSSTRNRSRQSRHEVNERTNHEANGQGRYETERPNRTTARGIHQQDHIGADQPPRSITRRPRMGDRSIPIHYNRTEEDRSSRSDRHLAHQRDHAYPQRHNRSRHLPYQRDRSSPRRHYRSPQRPTHETRAPDTRYRNDQPERRVTVTSQSGNYHAQDSSWRREQRPRTHGNPRGEEPRTGSRNVTRRVIYRSGGA